MKFDTKILPPKAENIMLSGEYIRNGEVVGFPTETVYGLAANAFDEDAVSKIFIAKGRPQDNPLIVHISDINMLDKLTKDVSPTARKLAEKFWAGALTIILPKSENVSDVVTAGLKTVAVRFPDHEVAIKMIQSAGVPLAAPSANISGSPSPTTAKHVLSDMSGKIPIIVDGGSCEVGLESTVVAVDDDKITILRPGKITMDDLLMVTENVTLDASVLAELSDSETAISPGQKYKHYSPKAKVVIVEGDLENFKTYMEKNKTAGTFGLVFSGDEEVVPIECVTYGAETDSEQNGRLLFDALRKLDEKGAKIVLARPPRQDGVGLAVYNRLLRSAGFEIVKA